MPEEVDGWKCTRTGRVFATEEEARKSENRLPREKISQLKKRIKLGKYWVPKAGDVIYVGDHFYLDHGEDDVAGGLAQVTHIVTDMSGSKPSVFVEVAQIDGRFNWKDYLYEEQADFLIEFGNDVAHPDPDKGVEF
jgi:hypothetical protein